MKKTLLIGALSGFVWSQDGRASALAEGEHEIPSKSHTTLTQAQDLSPERTEGLFSRKQMRRDAKSLQVLERENTKMPCTPRPPKKKKTKEMGSVA